MYSLSVARRCASRFVLRVASASSRSCCNRCSWYRTNIRARSALAWSAFLRPVCFESGRAAIRTLMVWAKARIVGPKISDRTASSMHWRRAAVVMLLSSVPRKAPSANFLQKKKVCLVERCRSSGLQKCLEWHGWQKRAKGGYRARQAQLNGLVACR